MKPFVSQKDQDILKRLAEVVAKSAENPIQTERMQLWDHCNQLTPIRPVVYADPQNGWEELIESTELECESGFARDLEYQLRQKVFRIHNIPDDFFILPEVKIGLAVHKSSYGVENLVNRSAQRNGAYKIVPAINNEEDFQKLKKVELSIDWEDTAARMEVAHEIFDGILNVRLTKVNFIRCGLTRVLVHLRGLDQMMYDLYDHPDWIHRLMRFLMEEQIREYQFYQDNNALDMNTCYDGSNGSGGLTYQTLFPQKADGVMMSDMMAWGESQEFVTVGPDQFEEFVFQYQQPILNMFGIVDYGCCEPLDNKYDIIMKGLPKLRSIAVSPWANKELAAKKIGNRYVYVYKPNPAYICCEQPDYEAAKKDITEAIQIAQACGCPMHIVMKDTSTFCHDKQRITKWSKMAHEVVERFYYR